MGARSYYSLLMSKSDALPIVADPSGQLSPRVQRTLKTSVRSAKTTTGLRRHIASAPPPLLIGDVSMPGLMELVEASHAASPTMNVLFLTAEPAVEPLGSMLKPGLIDVLRTPFSDSELKLRLDSLAALRPTLPLAAPRSDLHDPRTGRIDAKKVATAFGLSLRSLAAALDRTPQSLSKTPTAQSVQDDLGHYQRTYEILRSLLGDPATVRAWLNSPQPDLAGKRPVRLIEDGQVEAVRDFLEIVYAGGPI